jgi:hypothetical protein
MILKIKTIITRIQRAQNFSSQDYDLKQSSVKCELASRSADLV